MSHQWKADKHLRHAVKMARAAAKPFPEFPRFVQTPEQKSAFYLLEDAKSEWQRREALSALMSAAYELNALDKKER